MVRFQPSTDKKSVVVGTRMKPEDRRLITIAAAHSGKKLGHFMLEAAKAAAWEVVEREHDNPDNPLAQI